MAEALILRFAGGTVDDYKKVHEALGLDFETNEGEWPDGLITHAGGEADGALYLIETWESREAQQRWMEGRIARAFQETQMEIPPPDVTWIPLFNQHIPERAAVSS